MLPPFLRVTLFEEDFSFVKGLPSHLCFLLPLDRLNFPKTKPLVFFLTLTFECSPRERSILIRIRHPLRGIAFHCAVRDSRKVP